jgi:hypothetical protein
MMDYVIIKEYEFKDGSALLARKSERWLLVVSVRQKSGIVGTTVYGIDEASVNKDAKELGLTPAKVAEHECDGMMKKRGWEP